MRVGRRSTGGGPGPVGPRCTARVAATVVGLLLVAVSCGIPTGGEPQALAKEDHQDLLVGTSTTSTTVLADTVNIRLFFIGPDNRLESVTRPYEANPQVNTILGDLELSPREDEQEPFADLGGVLQTFVPVDLEATLLRATPEDEARGVRVLSVNSEAQLRQFLETEPAQSRLAVSQLVCTFLNLGGLDGVNGVEFRDDEGLITTLTDTAAQPIEGPATKDDFNGCRTGTEEREALAESSTTTTTASGTTSTERQS